ncbi:hypothetical protein SpCBS45565_g07886 [Spizellomyces sp. 'palustris']|nr:hypothetical protein SpCBS45565_g07886 [Spizellomyces sp. 'palustris']
MDDAKTVRFMSFLRKRCRVNPSRGPFHLHSPNRILWRTIRGMIPHKTPRGQAALQRLRVFEGVPPPYDKRKRMVMPMALRVLRLAPGRKYTVLKRLSSEFGWRYQDVVSGLEDKRKAKAHAYYEAKKAARRLLAKAEKEVETELAPIKEQLAAYGY